MPFTVYDRLVKALQLDSFRTLGIEVVLFTLSPLRLATMPTIQAVIDLVIGSPILVFSSAGYPIHHGFGEGLMTIIPLGYGKGEYYIVE